MNWSVKKLIVIVLKISFIVLICLLLLFLAIHYLKGETSIDKSNYKTFKLFDDFKGNIIDDDFNVIEVNFSDLKLQSDTIEMNFVLPEWEFVDHVCSFNFPSDYKVIRVDRKTEFCPSIFDDEAVTGVEFPDDTNAARQFLKLNDLKQFVNRPLDLINVKKMNEAINSSSSKRLKDQIKSNKALLNRVLKSSCLFYYTEEAPTPEVWAMFKNIDNKLLEKAIGNEIKREFANEEKNTLYHISSYWGCYLNRYNKGDFSRSGKIYGINKFDVLLKISFEKDDEPVVKYFHFWIHVGN